MFVFLWGQSFSYDINKQMLITSNYGPIIIYKLCRGDLCSTSYLVRTRNSNVMGMPIKRELYKVSITTRKLTLKVCLSTHVLERDLRNHFNTSQCHSHEYEIIGTKSAHIGRYLSPSGTSRGSKRIDIIII